LEALAKEGAEGAVEEHVGARLVEKAPGRVGPVGEVSRNDQAEDLRGVPAVVAAVVLVGVLQRLVGVERRVGDGKDERAAGLEGLADGGEEWPEGGEVHHGHGADGGVEVLVADDGEDFGFDAGVG